MAIIRVLQTDGDGSKNGQVSVNSYNVDPTAKVAGTDTIAQSDLKKYDFFNITSGAATANVLLNDDIAIGSKFILYVGSNGMEIIGGGAGLLNGGTAAQVIDIAADSSAIIYKSATNAYVVQQLTAAGALTAPTPATDG